MNEVEEKDPRNGTVDKREALMEEVMGFWQIRVILTGAELDLFTLLDSGGPSTADSLAVLSGSNGRALARLLDALAALGFLKKEGENFTLSQKGEILLARHPETVLPMLLHFNDLWLKWSDLTEVIRRGRPAEELVGATGEASRKDFIGAMHAIGLRLSMQIAAAVDVSGFRRLLDIGGGSGVYTIAFLKRNPGMTAVLFRPAAGYRYSWKKDRGRGSFRQGQSDRRQLLQGRVALRLRPCTSFRDYSSERRCRECRALQKNLSSAGTRG